ncbi:MAG: undecaprenyl-diphosphate phosphatase [bacterium]
MDLVELIFLALIQGLTEFLPISSSAHLILPSQLLGWEDQGLAFDVAVHVGSLCAVLFYFRRDIAQLASGWFGSLAPSGEPSHESRLVWAIGFATIPAGLAGLAFDSAIETHMRSTLVISVTTILFAILLAFADRRGTKTRSLTDITLKLALIVGVAQALALIPGTSRSGITITAALLLGFDRESAARFSFLLSIPVIVLSGGYKAWQLLGSPVDQWTTLMLGALISGVAAFVCIHLFITWINRIGMMPFVWYRLALGAVLMGMVII